MIIGLFYVHLIGGFTYGFNCPYKFTADRWTEKEQSRLRLSRKKKHYERTFILYIKRNSRQKYRDSWNDFTDILLFSLPLAFWIIDEASLLA